MARFYKDIDLSLEEDTSTNDIRSLDDEDAVKVSMINLVMTAMGEKLFQLQKGTNIRKLLFSPLNQYILFRLERQISAVIANFEPRVDRVNVEVYFYAEQNLLASKIYFRVIGSDRILDITLPLTTLR